MYCYGLDKVGVYKDYIMFTQWQNRETCTDAERRLKRNSLLIGCHQAFLITPVFRWGQSTLAWQLFGASWLGATIQRFHDSYTSAVLGSDDWQSANGHQRLPNNGARALISVIVMLDPYNIWKPPCWNLPQPLSPIPHSKYFPLLYHSLHCTSALAMFSHHLISVSIADTISAYLYVFRKIRNQAIVLLFW